MAKVDVDLVKMVMTRTGLDVRTVAQVIEEINLELKAQADETVRAYEKSLADARAKAHSVAAEAKAAADAEVAEAIRKADAELEAKLAESEDRIRASRDAALGEVRTIAADTAVVAVEHLAGLEVSEDDAAKAVDAVKE